MTEKNKLYDVSSTNLDSVLIKRAIIGAVRPEAFYSTEGAELDVTHTSTEQPEPCVHCASLWAFVWYIPERKGHKHLIWAEE